MRFAPSLCTGRFVRKHKMRRVNSLDDIHKEQESVYVEKIPKDIEDMFGRYKKKTSERWEEDSLALFN